MYHCFGCGVSGNVITFVMEYEIIHSARRLRCWRTVQGVKLPKMEYSKEAKAKADRKAALLEINKLAANYFYYQPKQPQGKIGYDYLVKRKLTDETIRRFDWDFPIKSATIWYRYLKSKGYEDELLKDTGWRRSRSAAPGTSSESCHVSDHGCQQPGDRVWRTCPRGRGTEILKLTGDDAV